MATFITQPAECRILVVDDEAETCGLLCRALEPRYRVTGCRSGREACGLIDRDGFDVVVTDLRLEDSSGIEVLRCAKAKDPYTEVLLVTGYASFESASVALELGAISYIEKPVKLEDFIARVEKAVASRLFHLKSLVLMEKSGAMSAEFKGHLSDITALYYFTRKVTLSIEVGEIVRITLEEISRRSGAPLCAVGISAMGVREIYAMCPQGEPDPADIKKLCMRHREAAFPFFEKKQLEGKAVRTYCFKRAAGAPPPLGETRPVAIPLSVTGTTIGSTVLYFDRATTVDSGDLHFYNVVSSIVAPLIEHGCAVRQVRQLAKTDALTGIANHRAFLESLDQEIARANRKGGVFSLIFMDIDDFKRVNDTFGHQAGDAVLRDLVGHVAKNIRAVDGFSRYGGEEFAIVLPETSATGAEVVARRIKKAITARPFLYDRKEIRYTVSMGIARYNGRLPSKKKEIIDQADAAMYAAKRDGKNRISVSAAAI